MITRWKLPRLTALFNDETRGICNSGERDCESDVGTTSELSPRDEIQCRGRLGHRQDEK